MILRHRIQDDYFSSLFLNVLQLIHSIYIPLMTDVPCRSRELSPALVSFLFCFVFESPGWRASALPSVGPSVSCPAQHSIANGTQKATGAPAKPERLPSTSPAARSSGSSSQPFLNLFIFLAGTASRASELHVFSTLGVKSLRPAQRVSSADLLQTARGPP